MNDLMYSKYKLFEKKCSIDEHTVRIEMVKHNSVGTGFLYTMKDSSYVYIITSCHIICKVYKYGDETVINIGYCGKNKDYKKSEINICTLYDESEQTAKLCEKLEDEDAWKTRYKDIAVLRIKKRDFMVDISSLSTNLYRLSEKKVARGMIFVGYGFPDNKTQYEALYGLCYTWEDKNQMITCKAENMIYQPFEEAMKGFSGTGLIAEYEGAPVFIGIVASCDKEEKHQQFRIVGTTQITEKLRQIGWETMTEYDDAKLKDGNELSIKYNCSGGKRKADLASVVVLTASVGVVIIIAGGLILKCINSKPNNVTPIDVQRNTIVDETVPDDIIFESNSNDFGFKDPSIEIEIEETIPNNNIMDSENTPIDTETEETIPDNNNAIFEHIPPEDTTLDSVALDEDIPNGTMPKGTKPNNIPISEEMKETLTYIQKLSIGSTKNWIDDKLGTPYAENVVEVTEEGRLVYDINGNIVGGSNKIDEYLECVYIFDIVSVKVYFDMPDRSCKAFFVTLMEDASGVEFFLPEVYSSLVSNKSLGEFSFSEISWDPINVYGYVSQGVGRAFYGEQYYFMGIGNYQNFYFAILDYGMLDSYKEFGRFLSLIQDDIRISDDDNSYYSSDLLTQQRDKFYPNTYGISTLSYKITFSLLGTYVGFDSLPLRGQ